MILALHNVDTAGKRLAALQVNRQEALLLVRSLMNQLIDESPNAGRLESPCKGQADELTVYIL